MASNSAVSLISATLSTTTVDTCTLTGSVQAVRVWNLTGTAALYVTLAPGSGGTPTAPTAGGDGCLVIPAGLWRVIPVVSPTGAVVKLIGNGNAYVVEAA